MLVLIYKNNLDHLLNTIIFIIDNFIMDNYDCRYLFGIS